jgi:uncharacterized protein (DUF1684 family)
MNQSDAFAEKYAAALADQRDEKDYHFRNDPYSPIPWEEREAFKGLSYFPPNLDLRLTIPLEREAPEPIQFQTTTGAMRHYDRIGTLGFTVEGEAVTLALYEAEPGEFFLPFRDATSGTETYGAGRYLEPIEIERGTFLVDFNLAYSPYCAYAEEYSCPLPPIENWLKVPIRAGETVEIEAEL